MFSTWRIFLVSVDTIHDACYIVPDIDNVNTKTLLLDRKLLIHIIRYIFYLLMSYFCICFKYLFTYVNKFDHDCSHNYRFAINWIVNTYRLNHSSLKIHTITRIFMTQSFIVLINCSIWVPYSSTFTCCKFLGIFLLNSDLISNYF